MKKLILINFSNVFSFSVRAIASFLKKRGYNVAAFHYAASDDKQFEPLGEERLNKIYQFCEAYDVVGFSLTSTHNLVLANQITRYIRSRSNKKMIWGGVPVICDPEFYLNYIEYVCVGEGEVVMSRFMEQDDPFSIPGVAYRNETGEIIVNEMEKRINLNSAPIPYLDLANTYIMKNDRIASLKEDPQPLYQLAKKGYRIFPIRGCPHACTFCANNKLNKIFQGKGAILRSVQNNRIIDELIHAKKTIPSLKSVMFYEDDFMVRNIRDFRELLKLYGKEVALPFTINSTCELITEEKLDIITKNGGWLKDAKIGLQSGSERINKNVFKRHFSKKWYLEKLPLMASRGFHVTLDVISDNPYENIEDKHEAFLFYHDLARAVRKVSIIKIPLSLMDHKLMFYPGTKMYDDAIRDGYIDDNYIEKVLLTRKTTRNKFEDFDNDSFIISLFGLAMRKGILGKMANITFYLCKAKPVYKFLYTFKVFKYTFMTAKMSKALLKRFVKAPKK